MANDYFNPTPLIIPEGTRARASQVNSVSNALEASFDKLPTEPQLKQGLTRYAVDTGVADAYIADTPYTFVLADGVNIYFKAVNANTGPSTINVNNTGAKAIKNPDGTDIAATTFAANAIVQIAYESAGDRWILLSQNPAQANAAAASAQLAADRAGYSQEWATTPEDTLVSADAGGNQTTDFSSLHHAAKASASAGAAATEVTYSAEWATKAEDSLISVAAGGNGSTDFSSLHHAAKAEGSASAAAGSVTDAANEVTYAAEWATKPEDSLISVAAGGDGSTDFSALHWSAKAEGFAASINPVQFLNIDSSNQTKAGGLTIQGQLTTTQLGETEGTVGGTATTPELDLSTGTVFSHTVSTGPTTFSAINVPTVAAITLYLTNAASQTITWFTGTSFGDAGEPAYTAGLDVLVFITRDGGTTWQAGPFGFNF